MTIKTSDLDFNELRKSLKAHLRQSGTFSDYNFEGSGLSSILDVLAYNTHLNGLTANMAINESFLSSSQIRASALAHAETLGYTPKSKVGASSFLTVSITPTVGEVEVTVPEGHEFIGQVDEVGYTFRTTDPTTIKVNDDGLAVGIVKVSEGQLRRRTFQADVEYSQYVIPDEDLDATTLKVEVFDSYTSDRSTSYLNIDTVSGITDNSRIFFVKETSNGHYEILFSDGNVLGQKPKVGSKIVVTYLKTSGTEGNGAATFTTKGVSQGLEVLSATRSSGGSAKESLESIKLNAPRGFASQRRLVTAEDYTSMISNKYAPFINDVVAWGGNDNVPPEYGKVFVSLNPRFGVDLDDLHTRIKDELTSNLSIMSIDTEFTDPEVVYITATTVFNIDPTISTETQETYRARVEEVVVDHFADEMNKFNSSFRRSPLLSKIDDLSPAILNSKMSISSQSRINIGVLFDEVIAYNSGITVGLLPENFIVRDFDVNFPFLLASPDKDEHVITTSAFKYNGKNVVVKNELGSYRLQIFDTDGNVILSNVGSYDPAKGSINLRGLRIEEGTSDTLRVNAVPANQSTIKPLRNYILRLDPIGSSVTANVESDTIGVLL